MIKLVIITAVSKILLLLQVVLVYVCKLCKSGIRNKRFGRSMLIFGLLIEVSSQTPDRRLITSKQPLDDMMTYSQRLEQYCSSRAKNHVIFSTSVPIVNFFVP